MVALFLRFLLALVACNLNLGLKTSKTPRRLVTTGTAGCRFCRVSVARGFDIVWEDETFVAFHDRKPAAMHHILIVPKAHIDSVKCLDKSDTHIVRSMKRLGHQLLDDLGVPLASRRMGFHIPPLNSVNHLHMHVQAMPYKLFTKKFSYRVVQPGRKKGRHKGFSWFVEVDQMIAILEDDGHVKVMPC